jgi:hypothetical protein
MCLAFSTIGPIFVGIPFWAIEDPSHTCFIFSLALVVYMDLRLHALDVVYKLLRHMSTFARLCKGKESMLQTTRITAFALNLSIQICHHP